MVLVVLGFFLASVRVFCSVAVSSGFWLVGVAAYLLLRVLLVWGVSFLILFVAWVPWISLILSEVGGALLLFFWFLVFLL